ncbi:Putative histone deacetylase 2 [Caenorhabditis elegans]|uniref:Putative histone deacetylase 2 n=1 Tax=Caenorhabditis elegans TaxID=6239 RepID=HDA2_CAEEL|nr:Putative histone deacetylase 2 [Caenorhabditis elegans]Q09440.1 RecName: Full=Putative histone deacetylase 2 [Caenorhabditis elegans]CAA86662.1 Putative histone deacetylase 2 [Caenorhabditis elegans]|eukprot:NP_495678.1 Putative histone deacetylase 2 [Caenorhabditis elegans]
MSSDKFKLDTLFDDNDEIIEPDGADVKKRNVAYYYHKDVGHFHYGQLHPMKPQRLVVCNDLVVSYEMPKYMTVVESPKLDAADISVFHTEDYVNFLQTVTPKLGLTMPDDVLRQFNIGEDCPIFAGLWDYCTLYAGGSVEGARRLNHKMNDIVINWPGGLHHAKKSEASGFCYVNDIVLGILELLKYHKRVLYIDIDIHHGDGVQEAFNNSDRVMTVSFHRFGQYFPGSGSIMDKGVGPGKYFAINVPLMAAIRDEPYLKLFESVISGVEENFNPEAIVLQCGSDSLCEDRLGQFALSFNAHARAVKYVKSLGKPLMVLGGGGYTLRNVARCWALETGVILGLRMDDEIPGTSLYSHYFTPRLLRPNLVPKMNDANSAAYLASIEKETLACLRMIRGAPSVQMQNIVGIRLDEIEQIEENERLQKSSKSSIEYEVGKVSEKMEEECFVEEDSKPPSFPPGQDPRRIGQYWGYDRSGLAPPRSHSDVIEEAKYEDRDRRKDLNIPGIP